jgi:hypothetical protein
MFLERSKEKDFRRIKTMFSIRMIQRIGESYLNLTKNHDFKKSDLNTVRDWYNLFLEAYNACTVQKYKQKMNILIAELENRHGTIFPPVTQ